MLAPKKFSLIVRAMNSLIFIVGLGLSIYQSKRLIHNFSVQPTISRIIPQQNTTMQRPDIVVCKNIYSEIVASDALDGDMALIRLMAMTGGNYGVYLRSHISQLLNASVSVDQYERLGRIVDKTAAQFRNCTSMLGKCCVLRAGTPAVETGNCCSSASQGPSFKEICYSVSSDIPQDAGDKMNAAIYELRFDNETKNNEYSVYIKEHGKTLSLLEEPTLVLGSSEVANVNLALRVSVGGNFSENCSQISEMASPVCPALLFLAVVREICRCEVPLNLYSYGDITNNNSTEKLRMCWPLEMLCLSNPGSANDKFALYQSRISKCYSKLCEETKFGYQITTSRMTKGSHMYLASADDTKGKFSVLYVYYGTMTILYEVETKALDWLGMVSSLGGVTGLWIGWSVYDVGQLLLKLAVRVCTKSESICIRRRRMSVTIESAP